MKKIYLQTIFALFALFFISNAASAQMTQYTWSEYDMQFKIPGTFNVTDNNKEKFSAGDDNIWLTIYPKTGSALTYSEMSGMLQSWAKENGVYAYGSINTETDFNGYWGVYLEGKLAENDLPVYLAMYVHPDFPSQYFYTWINYNQSSFNTAAEILASFQPM